MRTQGKITHWNDARGYGFITPAAGAKQVFFHIRSYRSDGARPALDERVSFDLSQDRQGRPCAVRVMRAGEEPRGGIRSNDRALMIGGSVLFLAGVGLSVAAGSQPPELLGFYIVISALTYIVYAMDKSAAQSGAQRIREVHLHALALIGGWPGAMIAQQVLRHKSVKTSFRHIFWLTVALNIGVFIGLFTPQGSAALQDLIRTI